MSFSSEAKDEMSRVINSGRHCQIAEIAAIISLCGNVHISKDDKYMIRVHTENVAVARKFFLLIKKTFNINTEISIKRNTYLKKSITYTITIKNNDDALKILHTTHLMDEDMEIGEEMSLVNNLIIHNTCCKRAFIRGAFLATGSISDPEKFYHFEIVCPTEDKARQLQGIINTFDIDSKIVKRKKHYIVYVKEGAQIVDLLNVMEAHVALMKLENIRILKEMRNSVNRKVNCETANINKTVSAAVKQLEDIKIVSEKIGFDNINENLAEIAKVRLDNPDATLKELGEFLDPPVGKSGVNHRLRKLSDLADTLRDRD